MFKSDFPSQPAQMLMNVSILLSLCLSLQVDAAQHIGVEM